MEEKIKNIVSLYIKVSTDQITNQTLIDRTAVASSIILHRMYGNLRNEGVPVDNYWDIKTFGDLLWQVNVDRTDTEITDQSTLVEENIETNLAEELLSTGSDIEEVKNMPVVNDFREDEFYTMNFHPSEIAYAILQPDPFATFAGLFAAKEAIVKADNTYRSKKFSTIFIDHLPSGKPFFPDFSISISHTSTLAMATAVRIRSAKTPPNSLQNKNPQTSTSTTNWIIYSLLFIAGALSACILFYLRR